MIQMLDNNNRSLIENNSSRSASALRIKALFRAYGIGRSFISFFSDENGDILISTQDNFAVVHVVNDTLIGEVSAFLSMTVNTVLCELPLELNDYNRQIGTTYLRCSYRQTNLSGVSGNLQTGFCVLSKVFCDSINSTTYNRWYTDMSHRIRHNMSKIYTYRGKCSATAYLIDSGTLMLAQLGTLEAERHKGYAEKMINHIATDFDAQEIMLLSQDQKSDRFYEKIGFEPVSQWYYYER